MRVFDFLQVLRPDFRPQDAKVHCAVYNGIEDPLDVWLRGDFEEWQKWQNDKNFERKLVVSLIKMPQRDHWLFVGVFRSYGSERRTDPTSPISKELNYYNLVEDPSCHEMAGRLVARFEKGGIRQSYLLAENWQDKIALAEIRAEPLAIREFPGFRAVDLSRSELELMVRTSVVSWRTALSNVAGIYLISDTESGKLYVGKACGTGGIWQRWSSYAATGHGGNRDLKRLLAAVPNRVNDLRYSILEIADVDASEETIDARESHWKEILMTRKFGLNAN